MGHQGLEAAFVGGHDLLAVLGGDKGEAHELGGHHESETRQDGQGVDEGRMDQRRHPVQGDGDLADDDDRDAGDRGRTGRGAAVGPGAVDDAEQQAERQRGAPTDGVDDRPDDEHLHGRSGVEPPSPDAGGARGGGDGADDVPDAEQRGDDPQRDVGDQVVAAQHHERRCRHGQGQQGRIEQRVPRQASGKTAFVTRGL